MLPLLSGKDNILEKIAAFAGVLVGAELRRARELGAIEAIPFGQHDQQWRRPDIAAAIAANNQQWNNMIMAAQAPPPAAPPPPPQPPQAAN